jgi:hypothetical protein
MNYLNEIEYLFINELRAYFFAKYKAKIFHKMY